MHTLFWSYPLPTCKVWEKATTKYVKSILFGTSVFVTIAVSSLNMDNFFVTDIDFYESLTDEQAYQCLKDVSFPKEEFSTLTDCLVSKLAELDT